MFKKIRTKSLNHLIQCCLSTLLLTTAHCAAQDEFFSTINIDVPKTKSSNYSVIGWITQSASYGLEQPSHLFGRTDSELNGLQPSLFIQADGKFSDELKFRVSGKYYHDPIYQIKSDAPHSIEERNQLRNRLEIRDFYFDYQAENGLYFKVGNQILAWGLSEYIRVTDQINVEDQFAIAQQDLEDLRLPAPAAHELSAQGLANRYRCYL